MLASVGNNLEGTVRKSRIALNRAVTRLEKKKAIKAAEQLSRPRFVGKGKMYLRYGTGMHMTRTGDLGDAAA